MGFFFHRKIKTDNISWLGVDMHNHLLPGIDDGALTIGQSVHFIRTLANLGFNRIYCTPHIFTGLYPNNLETINGALNSLKSALNAEQSEFEVNAAAEYMLDETFKVSEKLLCLPGQYVLLEMSYLVEMPELEQVVFELQVKGFKVILAHPERYSFYHKKLERYRRLKDIGVLFQLNLLSLAGYYGKHVKSIAANLLQKGGYYDFAGTDLHHQRHLDVLVELVCSGRLYQMIGQYHFKNKDVF